MHLSLIDGVELKLIDVSVGPHVRASLVRAFPGVGALLMQEKVFDRIELEDLEIAQSALGGVLFGRISGEDFKVERVVAQKAKLHGALPLPPLDVEIVFGADAKAKSASLKSAEHRLSATLVPQGDSATIEIIAGTMPVPFVAGMSLSEFGMKGTVDAQEMLISSWDARVLDGMLSGTASIRWAGGWSVEGELRARQINIAALAPALLADGKADARGTFAMRGAQPDKLGAAARVEGSFSVGRGALGSFDLARALQPASLQVSGRTPFGELQGNGVYDRGVVQLRDVKISAGLLIAVAELDIDAGGNLSGRLSAEARHQASVLRGSFSLTGTSREPQIRR